MREEVEGHFGGPSVGVRNGTRWWRYDPYSGAISNEHDPQLGSDVGDRHAHVFDPAEGTRITLTSRDLDLDTLVGLAGSLVPAPGGPRAFA